MRRSVLLLASAALAILFISAITGSPPAAQTTPIKPNFVLIYTDDMRKDDLAYMPNTRNLIASQGMTFDNAYVPLSSCCPSRASVMRGQYPHNHKVWLSSPSVDFPNQGGWEGYHAQGHENDNIATRLDAAGYRTGIFGKYLNGYKETTGKPAGWDDFFVKNKGQGSFNYNMNDNGTTVQYGSTAADYFTDVMEAETRNFIAQAAPNNPFYAEFTPIAPHTPTIPAPRHQNALDGLPLDKGPAYNEADVSDKPSFIQDDPIITAAGEEIIRQHNEDRAETLLAIDESVQDIYDMVDAEGVLSNTYFIFTSDNGWMNGEHRIPNQKQQPYEEGSEMPLLIAGPGITANTSTDKLASLIDIMPTVLDYAGVAAPSYMDGRSLKPMLEGTATSWRHNVLLETINDNKLAQSYSGIVSDDGGTLHKYIEYRSGDKEYYNLNTDPNELNSDASAVPASLDSRLDALKACARDLCRSIENEGGGTPLPPPPDDTTDPQITITTPPQGASYTLGQSVAASYECTDADSGVASCEGPVTNGANIDTSSTGTKTFTVDATDNAANTNSVSHTYTVNDPTTNCTKSGTSNSETITGTSGADVICGLGGNDILNGLGGNDTLRGAGSNDTLQGGVGDDTLDGGTGTDTASYSASLTAVSASLATLSSTGEGSDIFVVGVENLLGSSNADTLSGSDTNNTLTGGGGNDQLIGNAGADNLSGSGGNDTVDSKDGVSGNDTLNGGAGTDTKVTDATERSITGFP